ncbi:MAG: MbnP family protein [Flavobacteriales bacterium]
MKNLLFLFSLTLILSSCKKEGCINPIALNFDKKSKIDDGSCEYDLSFNFIIKNNGNTIQPNDIIEFENNSYRLERLKFYISNFSFNNSSVDENSNVHLFDLDKPESHSVKKTINTLNYSNFTFSLGLDSLLNSSDPSEYETDHPLGLNSGTYWPMSGAPSYIFVIIEGKIDTTGDGSFFNKTYHLAHSKLLRNVSIDYDFKSLKTDNIDININIANVFDNIDFSDDLPHRSDNSPLANEIMNNFTNAFEIQ